MRELWQTNRILIPIKGEYTYLEFEDLFSWKTEKKRFSCTVEKHFGHIVAFIRTVFCRIDLYLSERKKKRGECSTYVGISKLCATYCI